MASHDADQHDCPFCHVVSALALEFVGLPNDEADSAIESALGLVGEFLGVDRSYVICFDEDGLSDNTHEWCAAGIAPQKERLKRVPVSHCPWFMARLERFEAVSIPRVADLPQEARAERELLQSQDIQSAIAVPMVCGGRLHGFVGFDSVRSEREWAEECLVLVVLASKLFGEALCRRKHDRAHREELEELEVRVQQRTANLEAVNRALVDEIAERRRTETMLRDTEARVRDAQRLAGLAFWEWDIASGKLIWTLETSETPKLGQEEQTRSYDDAWQAVHPDDRQSLQTAIARALEHDEPFRSQFRMANAAGHICYVSAIGQVARDGAGRALRISGAAIDITEQKLVESSLRTERDMAERLIATAQVIVLLLDLEGRIVRFNPFFTDITGYSLAELQGKPWVETMVPNARRTRVQEIFEAIIEGRPRNVAANMVVTKSGECREIEWRNTLLRLPDNSASGVLAIGHDVTEQRQAERALRESEHRLAVAERLASLGQLSAEVAHEINNPLAGIKNYLTLLQRALPAEHPDFKYFGRIAREVDRIAGIVRRMYEFHRPEPEAAADVDVRSLLEEVAGLIEPRSMPRGVRVEVQCPASTVVFLPENALRHVLFNLVANAVDASEADQLVLIDAKVAGRHLHVSVVDHGHGVAEEDRARIFEPFFTRKNGRHGMGIGLAVARQMVDSLGGRLEFTSEVGKGSEFRFIIPLP